MGGDALWLGKLTLGQASHWPCITNLSGLSTYGLNAQRMEDEHPAYAPDGAQPGLPFISRRSTIVSIKWTHRTMVPVVIKQWHSDVTLLMLMSLNVKLNVRM